MYRTQSGMSMPSVLERIRQAARRAKRQRFTALLHHVYDVERLRAAYFALRREAASGIDGETWRHDSYSDIFGFRIFSLYQEAPWPKSSG
jgi:RNA-directed DNA polymerase